ncbi:MAG: LCP family protein [Microgenomates group bacterium]
MRILKFVLIFFFVFVVGSGIATYIFIKSIPTISSNQTILILGKGGEGHTAPNLTDTIMIASLNKDKNKISFLSLPRDIWVEPIKAKLNTAYHYGGFKMAGESVNYVTNVPITNTIVVDFSLFKDVIDSMGGIKVDVENSFVDEKYPIAGKENDLCNGDRQYKCRYETVVFNKGLQTMNGELALKFVRSRNSAGDEGTDTAREKRQQRVISALKEKLLSPEVYTNFSTIQKIYNVFLTHTETDIDMNTAVQMARFVFESRNNINFLSIPEDMLKVSQNDKKYEKQYVFLPTDNTWKALQEWIQKEI